MNGSATLSEDGRYRYALHRRWGLGPSMLWVLLNPSTADATTDDPTLRRCIGFARSHRCGGLVVVNLWAWRASDPAELARAADPVGPDNDTHVAAAVDATTGPLVVGWGAAAPAHRVTAVLPLLGTRRPHCLGITRAGQPRHPLYVAATTRFRPW